MIELDDKGENYRIVWGLVNGGRPPFYIMNLEVKKLQNSDYRVVYHAHTTNIIALTVRPLPLEDKVFTRTVGDGNRVYRSNPDSMSSSIPWMVREAEIGGVQLPN